MQTVPVAFSFDDNFALPAWVAVKSLIDHAGENTFYDIFIICSRLNKQNRGYFKAMENGHARVNFVDIDNARFKNAPQSKAWPFEVYYRLIVPELIPQYDKVIYSDVDVMFKGDLSRLYNENLDGFQIAAVPAETMDEQNGVHQHYPEYKNDFIYFSGLIVFNNPECRKGKIVEKFFENMRRHEKRLKMFDLEVMNLSCDKIKPAGIEYCVLENLYYNDFQATREYTFLRNVYADEEIAAAKENPVIVHYAGALVKMWKKLNPEPDYFEYIRRSPYYPEYCEKQNRKKFLSWFNPLWYVLGRVLPSKAQRKKFRNLYRGNY